MSYATLQGLGHQLKQLKQEMQEMKAELRQTKAQNRAFVHFASNISRCVQDVNARVKKPSKSAIRDTAANIDSALKSLVQDVTGASTVTQLSYIAAWSIDIFLWCSNL